ncbi:MAG TPA: hypothetical protein VKI62_07345, partial [Bacteroidota bacterium]|nr:hypothetical protein [Bacteroidota bacterium]
MFLLLLMIVPTIMVGQSNTILVPYLSSGYLYQAVNQNSTIISSLSYAKVGTSESGYLTGSAAFGTLGSCSLNNSTHIKTTWPATKDLVIRKHLSLPLGAKNVKITVQVDNDVRVFFNGTDVSKGVQSHRSCATGTGDFTFSVPDTSVRIGDNLIAIWGDLETNTCSYFDMQCTGNVQLTITASAGSNGSITPSGSVLVTPGANQSFSLLANTGYHVQTLTVDGVTSTVATSSNAPSSSSYTFTSVNANHSISATFALNSYTITASAGVNGSINP